jgi:hypothetical protein
MEDGEEHRPGTDRRRERPDVVAAAVLLVAGTAVVTVEPGGRSRQRVTPPNFSTPTVEDRDGP